MNRPRILARAHRAFWGVRQEWWWGVRHVRRGRWSYLVNVVAYRALVVMPKRNVTRSTYTLETDSEITVHYRRERGDLQGIREIFIDEIYCLPLGARPVSLVDFGAHIGLAVLWLCHEYGISDVVVVEPVPENVALLRRNLDANGISATVVEAAVGAMDGRAHFSAGGGSNMGRLSPSGLDVNVKSAPELVASLPFPPSLLKMDIEGAEVDLLIRTDPSWLQRFTWIAVELHPFEVPIERCIEAIVGERFDYLEPTQLSRGHVRAKRERLFVRRGEQSAAV